MQPLRPAEPRYLRPPRSGEQPSWQDAPREGRCPSAAAGAPRDAAGVEPGLTPPEKGPRRGLARRPGRPGGPQLPSRNSSWRGETSAPARARWLAARALGARRAPASVLQPRRIRLPFLPALSTVISWRCSHAVFGARRGMRGQSGQDPRSRGCLAVEVSPHGASCRHGSRPANVLRPTTRAVPCQLRLLHSLNSRELGGFPVGRTGCCSFSTFFFFALWED